MAVRDELDIPLPAMAPSYRPSARRREEMDPATKRLAIFASVIGTALLGLVGVWAFTGHHHGGVPVIEADSRPVKVKPANPGGLQVDGANDAILSGESDGKESVAPGPEVPAPQALKAQEQAATPPAPAATGQTAAAPADAAAPTEPSPLPALRPHFAARATAAPPGSTATDGTASVRLIPAAKSAGPVASATQAAPRTPVRPPTRPVPTSQPALVASTALAAPAAADPHARVQTAQIQTVPVQSAPLAPIQAAPLPSPATQSAPPQTPTAAAKPPAAPSEPAPAIAAQAAPAAHGKRPLVQFAAADSGEAALREWQRLANKYPDLFGGRTPNITKTEHDGKTYWRIRTGGFADLTQAALFCQRLKAKGAACMVATF